MRLAPLIVCRYLLCTLALQSVSAFACTLPDMQTNERPVTPAGGPTEVVASIIVADFLGVDDVNQELNIDLRIKLSWIDPRLAQMEGCRVALSEVWFPQILMLNSSNLRASRRNALNRVAIGSGGRVTFINRYTGLVSSYHNLRQFPFDAHDFKISFASIEDPIEELVFVADAKSSFISERLNIEGWNIRGMSISSEPTQLLENEINVSKLELTVSAKRSPEFYIFRVILLLIAVVAMSWTIFWVPPGHFEFQIGLGATSMLTAIALYLSVSSSLPNLGYLTTLDQMLIWAIVLVFLSIVEALVSGLMVHNKSPRRALRLDRISRFVFPVLLFGGWAVQSTLSSL